MLSSAVVDNSAAEEAAAATNMKRKRKPSVKGLELQAEKGRKPIAAKVKPSGKSSKAKNKNGDGLLNSTSSALELEDDVTDENL